MADETPEAEERFSFEIAKHNAVSAKAVQKEVDDRVAAKKAELTAMIERITTKWNEVNAELLVEADEAAKKFTAVEYQIRQAALAQFAETGDKQIGHGVSIRVETKYEYEEEEAIRYSIEHKMPHMLKIDGVKFKKFASVTPLDFVKETTKPTPVVSYTEKS